MSDPPFLDAARALKTASNAIAVTGAGISEESGIPTFRGEHGIWKKYPVEEFATIDAYMHDPDKVWRFWVELAELVGDCEPNAGHRALARLEAIGHLNAIVTQNVDNLHQEAGNTTVIEYHGNSRSLVCLKCRKRGKIDRDNMGTSAPRCPACDGLMKPGVVMFGEMIPNYALYESEALAQKCDAMIIVGTSAQVYPAASLPFTAKQHGAYIIECNIERTEFTDTVTDAFLYGKAGEMLPKLVETLEELVV